MQSIEEGGLSERAIARARELASGADLRTTAPKQRSLPADADRRTRVLACGQLGNVNLPLPGTLITRMYKGRQLQVRVVTGGFEYEGELFKSLSAIAKKITGSHWSGNKFFNLSDKEVRHSPVHPAYGFSRFKMIRMSFTESGFDSKAVDRFPLGPWGTSGKQTFKLSPSSL